MSDFWDSTYRGGKKSKDLGTERTTVCCAYGFWLFGLIGICGIHRFYMGKKCTGVIWLLTFGVLTLGQIYDLFMMSSVMEDAQAQKEANVWDKRKLGHSKNAKIKAGGRQKWINENQ